MSRHGFSKLAVQVLTIAVSFLPPAHCEKISFVQTSREVIKNRLYKNAYGNGKRRRRLRELFEEAGCRGDQLTEQKVQTSRYPNVICTAPGETDSVIIVGAHFDAVLRSYGAVDNWSGASLLPSLFESVSKEPRKHTLVFIGFTDEETGLRGSKVYAKQLADEESQNVKAMVNLECLGLSPTLVWISRADPKLAQALIDIAGNMKLPLGGGNLDKIGATDSFPFDEIGIPTITIHSTTQESLSWIHTPKDRLHLIDLNQYYETYQLVAAYIVFLDTVLE